MLDKKDFKNLQKSVDRVSDPGNTIITRKKRMSNYLAGRMVVVLLTTLFVIYALYDYIMNSDESEESGVDLWWWFWLVGYAGLALFYSYYTYDKVKDVMNYNRVKDSDYINSIEDDEYMYVYGKFVGRLSDFEKRKEIGKISHLTK